MNRKQEKPLFLIFITILSVYFFSLSGCSTPTVAKVDVMNKLNRSVKPTVAVIDFKPDPDLEVKKSKPFVAGLFNNPNAGDVLADIFSQELSQSGLFEVMDREDVFKKLEKLGYNNNEGDNTDYYESLKKALGTDGIITGTYKRFGFLYPTIIPRIMVKFYAEYIDLNTNKRIWYVSIKGQSSTESDERDTARKKIKEAIKKLEKELYDVK